MVLCKTWLPLLPALYSIIIPNRHHKSVYTTTEILSLSNSRLGPDANNFDPVPSSLLTGSPGISYSYMCVFSFSHTQKSVQRRSPSRTHDDSHKLSLTHTHTRTHMPSPSPARDPGSLCVACRLCRIPRTGLDGVPSTPGLCT